MKNKIFKLIFILSFMPYVFALLIALKCAVFGVSFLGETLYYGFEGFFIGMIGVWVYYVLRAPILPICLIFQIGYIIIKLKNKKLEEL